MTVRWTKRRVQELFQLLLDHREAVLLLLLLLFVMTWHFWAISLDQRYRNETDNYLLRALHIYHIHWSTLLSDKDGPLAPLLALPLLLFQRSTLALRALGAVLHGVLIVQCYFLGRRLYSRAAAGLWAALLCATCPLIFGNMRLTFYDSVAAVAVVLSLQLMMRTYLDRIGPAVLLGVVLGGGLLVKISFGMNMVGPGIWFVLRKARRLRTLKYLAVLCLVAAALFVPWLSCAWHHVFHDGYLEVSKSLAMPVMEKLRFYGSLLGFWTYWGFGSLAALFLLASSKVDRWNVCLLMTYHFMLANLFLPPPWGRFLLPIFPLITVILGVALTILLEQISGRWSWLVSRSLVVLIIGLFMAMNLGWLEPSLQGDRRMTEGMLSPDTRPYEGYRSAASTILTFGAEALSLYDSEEARAVKEEQIIRAHQGLVVLWMGFRRAQERLARGATITVLLVRAFPQQPLQITTPGGRWLILQANRRLITSFRDPDGMTYQLYLVGPR